MRTCRWSSSVSPSGTTPEASLWHIERYDVPYSNLLDAEGRTAVTFGVTGVPEKFFLDREGVVLRKVIGAVSKEQLRAILDELLAS